MIRVPGLVMLAVVLGVVAASSAVRAESPRPKIGDAAGELRFKDIRYLPRSLKDFGEQKAYVLVFSNTTCPLAQKYWPKLKRLEAKYRKEGVQFVSVNVGVDDEINEIAQQAIDYGVEFPFVKDNGHSCVKGTGAQRTPEVVVLDAEKRIRYRGRVDDQYRLGGDRPGVTSDDLADAIDDLLAGREVRVSETPIDGCLITEPTPVDTKKPITFYENVLPIVQKHCQECHRPGANSPFSLLTLKDVVAQAETIAEVVGDRRMPPWHASRTLHFANERGLSAAERETIVAWTKTGKMAGDESKAPPGREFVDGKWEIGEPDLVTTAAFEDKLPAEGFIDYRYTILPYVFLHDTWISDAEILPSNPAVVHHCNMAYVALGQKFDAGNFITGRVPGGTAMTLGEGIAFRIPAGSVVALQIHYTTTGKEEKNRMSVGFKFPRYVVKQELHHVQVTTSRFEIPPGASAHPVKATRTLPFDATGLGMFSHMHLRGKDMTFKAIKPGGEQETLLSIPNYHYDWQQNYRWQPGTKKLPKGTQIEVTAHFDNSKFNPFNPNAAEAVRHGPQTVQEMMFGFFFYTADGEDLKLTIDPKSGAVVKSKEAAP